MRIILQLPFPDIGLEESNALVGRVDVGGPPARAGGPATRRSGC